MLAPQASTLYPEAGIDEAGRGCLAGPVFAAAVILPPDFYHPLLNDSKKMSPTQRIQLAPLIKEHALAWAVASASPQEIDTFNILNASILAMHRAIEKLVIKPLHLAIDGNRFKPYPWIAHSCHIKGDGRYRHIAAASVLAKTERDACMERLDLEFPMYQWAKNKGYPTKEHKNALREQGTCLWHRKSFKF
jgi:ribonuclease HII